MDPSLRMDTASRRCVDVMIAVIGLVVLFPLYVVLAVGVKLSSPGPVIYRQWRVGRDERLFQIWKLRSMTVGADRIGPLVSGTADPRVTPFGRWLRAARLDELPQLVNLLRGELTVFGPRPEVERFIGYYTPAERMLLRVRPGVLGPGALLFADTQSEDLNLAADPEQHYVRSQLHPKLRLDLDYLAARGPWRDLMLLGQTGRILLRRGRSVRD
ncbi:sugar transferase [Fodinicola acaciae]|uniref:sugar transferase n=1 Tax=Fodinicola acaciae TaxID=2681555 RepID=UPI0013D05D8D|nr:sugar transferase [Fodinicola acaciae]